jgi:hypothetical protein
MKALDLATSKKNEHMELLRESYHLNSPEVQAELLAAELIEQEQLQQEQQSSNGHRSRNARQRDRRRRNRRNRRQNAQEQNIQEEEQPHATDDGEALAQKDDSSQSDVECLLMCGKQLYEGQTATNVSRHDDLCPICHKSFGLELSESFSIVLPCKHGFCVSCISMLKVFCDSSEGTRMFECPLCKTDIPSTLTDSISMSILEQNEFLQSLAHELSDTIEDSAEVVCRLLEANCFDLLRVQAAIESMLTARSRSDLYSDRNLSYQDKKAIYDEARKPVEVLRQQLDQARAQLRTIYDDESTEWRVCYERILEIRRNLIHAEENARHTIYERINSAGGMGISMEDQDISQDFHGLHVTEAITMFDHQVKPVLPVVRRMILITGWGRHSDNGTSVVQQALKDHIDSEENRSLMRWHMIDDNMGAIKVTWIG